VGPPASLATIHTQNHVLKLENPSTQKHL